MRIPLFPLHTVLFPGGVLPLRIFEARYLDMISRCLRDSSGFGICLIAAGAEVGEAAEVHRVGTLARIIDWSALPGGLLGVTVEGERRFRVLRSEVRPDRLRVAEVELLDEPEPGRLPQGYAFLAELLGRLLDELGGIYAQRPRRPAETGWVVGRLMELLPLDLELKQHCLELDDPLRRLAVLHEAVRALRLD